MVIARPNALLALTSLESENVPLANYNVLSVITLMLVPVVQLDSISMEHHVYLGVEKETMPSLKPQPTQLSVSLAPQTARVARPTAPSAPHADRVTSLMGSSVW